MAYENREGSGSLFANRKREKETHPNARGDALIGGVLYEISAWTKTDKNGQKWQSLSFKPKQERAQDAGTAYRAAKDGAPFDDDLPF